MRHLPIIRQRRSRRAPGYWLVSSPAHAAMPTLSIDRPAARVIRAWRRPAITIAAGGTIRITATGPTTGPTATIGRITTAITATADPIAIATSKRR